MSSISNKKMGLFVSVVLLLTLTACAPANGAESTGPIRLGLLPVLDTLPVYIAEENGYFAEQGVEVEIIPVASPVERDQLMQAGEIDGMLNELTSTAVFNRDGVQIQAVITAREATADGAVFRILASPSSDISSPADVASVPIGVSVNTVIEYTTTRMLEAEGLAAGDIAVESVPVIPERFQLLMSGDLQAATLPDPLATAALEAGAKLVVDDAAHPFYSLSVLSFSVEALESNPGGVRGFLAAWDQAVADLNVDPEAYRALFLEKVRVPESVQDTYDIPPFPRAKVPAADQWADVLDWLQGKDLLDNDLPYEESITTDYLPE